MGKSSPDLDGIIFKICKRKGIFLTFIPSRHPKGKRMDREANRELGEECEQGQFSRGEAVDPEPQGQAFLSPAFKKIF